MPYFCFHVETDLLARAASEKLQAIVKDSDFLSASLASASDRAHFPFVGWVRDNAFKIHRNVYRNAFLPIIWGRIASTPSGSKINVRMFIHPFAAVFVAVILFFNRNSPPDTYWGILALFVAAPTCVFYWEALKAKKLIESSVLTTAMLNRHADE